MLQAIIPTLWVEYISVTIFLEGKQILYSLNSNKEKYYEHENICSAHLYVKGSESLFMVVVNVLKKNSDIFSTTLSLFMRKNKVTERWLLF